MTAKKSKIKDLNQVIKEKNELIQNLKNTINAKERKLKSIKDAYEGDFRCLTMYTKHIRKHFTKEFTWASLSDNPSEQIRVLLRALEGIDEVAATDR